jgi:hypothetical protein
MDRLMRHARQALFLALVAVLVTVTGAKALDADSPEYALRDAAGNNFRLIARVRHIPYSDRILVQSFGLRVNVMTVGHRAVCEDYRWTRSAPAPYNGRLGQRGAVSSVRLEYAAVDVRSLRTAHVLGWTEHACLDRAHDEW